MGLYEDHISSSNDIPYNGNPAFTANESDGKMPLGNITNQAGHRKNFSSHFNINDQSPSTKDRVRDENIGANKPEAHTRAVKTMEAGWNMYDESPPAEKGNAIKIFGDGMGSRKTGEKSWWDFET